MYFQHDPFFLDMKEIAVEWHEISVSKNIIRILIFFNNDKRIKQVKIKKNKYKEL